MNSVTYRRIVQFYRKAGVRVAISRATLSRMLAIAFPTLDIALDQLVADYVLEKSNIMDDQYKPTRGFVFDVKAAASDAKAIKAKEAREALDAKIAYAAKLEAARLEERRINREVALAAWEARKAEQRSARIVRMEKPKAGVVSPKRARLIALAKAGPIVVAKPRVLPKAIAPIASLGGDPWAKIRARLYSKPPLLESELRPLTDFEKMRIRA